jgi:ABC-type polysaccharide/polyol phosphate export permease
MVHLMDAYRAILIRGELPDQPSLLVLSVITAGLFFFGYMVFTRASYHFIEEL